MEKEYDFTPSFYNNEETFEKFLKQTSFYTGLQNNLLKVIKFANPKKILELGSATGETTIKVAKAFTDATVRGVDMRENIVEVATNSAKNQSVDNVVFETNDMVKEVEKALDEDFVYMLYSFHHIVDPNDNKVEFLKNLYNNLKGGSYVCIAEAFIAENAMNYEDEQVILNVWKQRSKEAFASTFWSSLKGLETENVKTAEDVGRYSCEKEYSAGELVAKRDCEYLVKASWLVEQAKNVGFTVVLNHFINNLEDKIILLRK